MRRDEENSFRDLKYTLDLLRFHAQKRRHVEQNLRRSCPLQFCGAIARHVDPPEPPKSKTRKYDYKILFAAAASVCLEYMKCDPASMGPCLLIAGFLAPIRPNRSFPRNVKSQSTKSFLLSRRLILKGVAFLKRRNYGSSGQGRFSIYSSIQYIVPLSPMIIWASSSAPV